MARFDLYRPKRGKGLLLDVQSGFLDALPSRVMVPLLPVAAAPPAIRGLNPVVTVEGESHAVMTHFMTAVERRELGRPIGNLAAEQHAIVRALDLLFTGF